MMMQLLVYLLKAKSLNQNFFIRISLAVDSFQSTVQSLHDLKALEFGRARHGSKLLLSIKV